MRTFSAAAVGVFLTVWMMPAAACSMDGFLSDEDKVYLLSLARDTLAGYLKNGSKVEIDKKKISGNLLEKGSCFVSLKKKGSGLRGCIGTFARSEPLYRCVAEKAIAAAVYDSRFPKVAFKELKEIKIEISVLTRPKQISFSSPGSMLNQLRPLKDGVVIKTEYGSSTFLPQVWEQIPEKEMFLHHLCRKHGAPGMIWRDQYRNVEILTYQAIVFSEKSYGGNPGGF